MEAEGPARRLLQKPGVGWWWPLVKKGTENRRLKEDLFAGRDRKGCGWEEPKVLFWAVGFQFILVVLSQMLVRQMDTQI